MKKIANTSQYDDRSKKILQKINKAFFNDIMLNIIDLAKERRP